MSDAAKPDTAAVSESSGNTSIVSPPRAPPSQGQSQSQSQSQSQTPIQEAQMRAEAEAETTQHDSNSGQQTSHGPAAATPVLQVGPSGNHALSTAQLQQSTAPPQQHVDTTHEHKRWTWAGRLKSMLGAGAAAPINSLAHKLGSQSFLPESLDKECDKAALILRAFCGW
ncbi:hypothetical protein E4U54_004899 [Claviceps lovelessii]|nr:hypothetical protein E4U54_004899 [Claviceps lovelessii]